METDKVICHMCKKSFTTGTNMRRHLLNIHKVENLRNSLLADKKNFLCCEDNCTFGSIQLQQLINHLQDTHKMHFQLGCEKFDSEEQFETWKSNFEKETNSRLLQRKGHVARKGVSQITYYRCNRSGFYRPKPDPADGETRKRKPRSRGSNKQNAPCTAYIDLTRNEYGLSAVFCKTHYRHAPTEVRFLPLDESIRMKFVQKISEGLPYEMVREDILKTAPKSEIPKIQRLSNKERNNLLSAYNLSQNEDPDDSTKLESWAVDMTTLGSDSPIQVFKPKGVASTELKMSEGDFCLVAITSKQIEFISSLDDESVLCVDSTPGLCAGHLEMLSLLVLDRGEAFPVAFMISNRVDMETTVLLFETIRDMAGQVNARGLMTPDNEIFLNAWVSVMEHSPKNFLNLWQVEIDMRKKLIMIDNLEIQSNVWKQILEYAHESGDADSLEDMATFVDRLISDSETTDYGLFFKEKYFDREELWTFRNRTTFHPEMNLKFEALHDELRILYLKCKKIKRLDKCIIDSIKIFKDKLIRRERNVNREKLAHRLSAINEMHAEGISIQAEIQKVSEKSWKVCLLDNTEYVRVEDMQCSACCEFRCEECQICIHMYTCNCECYLLQNTICKHIHFVNRWLKLNKAMAIKQETSLAETSTITMSELQSGGTPSAENTRRLRSDLSECMRVLRNISTVDCFVEVQNHVKAILSLLKKPQIADPQKRNMSNRLKIRHKKPTSSVRKPRLPSKKFCGTLKRHTNGKSDNVPRKATRTSTRTSLEDKSENVHFDN